MAALWELVAKVGLALLGLFLDKKVKDQAARDSFVRFVESISKQSPSAAGLYESYKKQGSVFTDSKEDA